MRSQLFQMLRIFVLNFFLGVVSDLPAVEQLRIQKLFDGPNWTLRWQGAGTWFLVRSASSLKSEDWYDWKLTSDQIVLIKPSESQAFFQILELPDSQVTVFPGGSIESLRALNPALEFGTLIIDGRLDLALWQDMDT